MVCAFLNLFAHILLQLYEIAIQNWVATNSDGWLMKKLHPSPLLLLLITAACSGHSNNITDKCCSEGHDFLVERPGNYSKNTHSIVLKDGYVPSPKVAAEIAKSVASGVYGETTKSKQRPYIVVEQNDKWLVHGSLDDKFTKGGVFEIEISKKDGSIIRLSHGK
jgi:hypothetical protein